MTDEEKKNIFCDLLGDKMSLIHEYGERKEQQGLEMGRKEGKEEGIKSIIKQLYSSGMEIPEIASRLKIEDSKVSEIINFK